MRLALSRFWRRNRRKVAAEEDDKDEYAAELAISEEGPFEKRLLIDPSGRWRSAHGGPGLEPGYDVGVALSGGGVRAALFGLGVLMATHDAKLLPLRIASVSGGSITNMMLADLYSSQEDSAKPQSREAEALWEAATESTFKAICRGSLTQAWLVAIAGFILGPPIVCLVLYAFERLPPPILLGPLFVIWMTVLLFRGLLIEALMARRYLGRGWRQRKLCSRASQLDIDSLLKSDHVFCCTDLLLGRPVHFASSGRVFRRTTDPLGGELPLTIKPSREEFWKHGLHYDKADEIAVPLSAILRATAGFPGIPPRLFRWKSYGIASEAMSISASGLTGSGETAPGANNVSTRLSVPLPQEGFLSDGGIWNNLATEPFEDHFLVDERGPWVVLVSDASGGPNLSNRILLSIPGVAELTALIRQEVLLASNTVAPRRQTYNDHVFTELRHPAARRFQVERLYPVVSCLETPEQLVARFEADFRAPDPYKYDEQYSLGIPARYYSVESRLNEVIGETEKLASFQRWSVLGPRGRIADPVAQYPTTLGAVAINDAVAIVARGYCNAALMLYLCNLSSSLDSPRGWLLGKLSRFA
jgi:predicted acylesterase/phospholipase RssA